MRKKKSAFTLVELVLTIALLGILGAIMGFMLDKAVLSYGIINTRRDSLSDARLAIDRMQSELRLITDTSSIISFSASAIQFSIPGDSGISYSLSGGALMRKTDILANNVGLFNLTYLDKNGVAIVIPSGKNNIWSIGVEVSVQAANGNGVSRLRSALFLRNLYYTNFN